MIRSILSTDYSLLHIDDIRAVHKYPSIVTEGFDVWKTSFSDSRDDNGKFNRYCEWGPFYRLVELLEKIHLMDNKIVIEYNNGLFVGFYDGTVTIGKNVNHLYNSPNIVLSKELKQYYNSYCNKEKTKKQKEEQEQFEEDCWEALSSIGDTEFF